jgi:signal peptidase I
LDGSADPKSLNTRAFLRDLLVALAVVGGVVVGTTRWIAIPWVVRGASMEPTLRDGDRVLVDLFVFRRREPRASDVVVVLGPGDTAMVKRVAKEPYPGSAPFPPPVLAAESALEPAYPVLGDNPPESSDSRTFGRIPRHRFRGRVVWRYWPLSRAGPIE